MVISDDNIHAESIGERYFLDISRTTVDSNHELGSALRTFLNCLEIQTETFVMAVWNVERNIVVLNSFEKVREHHRRGNAISVVVREDDDVLVIFYRCDHSLAGLLHIWQEKGVMQVGVIRIEESFLLS